MMEEDEVFLSILDGLVKKAREEMEQTGSLSLENAWPILLKGQYGHIRHLDEDVSRRLAAMDKKIDGLHAEMDQRFEKIDQRFEKIDQRFDKMFGQLTAQTRWMVGTMIAMSGIFIAVVKLMMP